MEKLDDDIRGNGKVGLHTRLDRLENAMNWGKNGYWIRVEASVPAFHSGFFIADRQSEKTGYSWLIRLTEHSAFGLELMRLTEEQDQRNASH